uniref:Anthrax toxin receptor extracellular domain-containing protein n=1 Tax=Oryctolagus cuniculus TaxID=9986 RepID=G1TNN9_RABIT
MEAIADSPDHIEVVEGPSTLLHAHVDWFCTRACLELREVDPDPVCAGDDIVNFIGYGFHNAKTEDNIICRFKFSDSDVVEEKAVRLVGRFKIQCPLPKRAKPNQSIIVEVSLNKGRNFLANDVSMNVVHCVSTQWVCSPRGRSRACAVCTCTLGRPEGQQVPGLTQEVAPTHRHLGRVPCWLPGGWVAGVAEWGGCLLRAGSRISGEAGSPEGVLDIEHRDGSTSCSQDVCASDSVSCR